MELKELFGQHAQHGFVVWIGIRPERRASMQVLDSVLAVQDKGLQGDRYSGKGGVRQVTLIQEEHLDAVASFMGKLVIPPELTRRNIMVAGLNLLALKGQQFRIGEAVLEYSGECHPCSRMEENLGTGGYNAMRGHGGITAKVIKEGIIRIGDRVRPGA